MLRNKLNVHIYILYEYVVDKLQLNSFCYIYRWMDVIGSATQHSGRMRLFSRKDSENNYSDIIVK